MSVYRASVPQLYADVDTQKAVKMGVRLQDLGTTRWAHTWVGPT